MARSLPQNHTMPLHLLRRQPDPVAAATWFAGAAGQAVLASEADVVTSAFAQWPSQMRLWLTPMADAVVGDVGAGGVLVLKPEADARWSGGLECTLPLPLASESVACIVVQHALESAPDPQALIADCQRVLLPGGWLWLLALNPLSPMQLRWRGHGLRGREPVLWRWRLRREGLTPDPISQGVGSVWAPVADARVQDGAGLRAAFVLCAQKRRTPLTPMRQPAAIRWRPESLA